MQMQITQSEAIAIHKARQPKGEPCAHCDHAKQPLHYCNVMRDLDEMERRAGTQ